MINNLVTKNIEKSKENIYKIRYKIRFIKNILEIFYSKFVRFL